MHLILCDIIYLQKDLLFEQIILEIFSDTFGHFKFLVELKMM